MKHISVNLPKTVPLIGKHQVVVIGGGPGGIASAIAAARNGSEVCLIEHYGFLGGMATAGEVNPFMENHLKNESLDKGIYTEWLDKMKQYGGAKGRVFDPIAARITAEEMCLAAGVKLLYHHRVAHVEMDGDKISAAVLHSKSGLVAIQADVFIDSTGDGDLAALAGAQFDVGGEQTGNVQPMTLCFKLKLKSPEDASKVNQFKRTDVFKAVQEAYLIAQREGKTSNPRENVLMFEGVDPSIVHFNSTRVIHKLSTIGTELSEAEIEGRKQARELIHILQKEIPLFKDCEIHSMASQIGIRESRRIKGHFFMTRNDYVNQQKYQDGITRVNYPIDIHNPNGKGTEITHLPSGAWYEVPYRCLLPLEINNLIIGSRCISADHAVHSSMRVMPVVMSIGQAAGTAAALSIQKHILPKEVNSKKLIQTLISQGRNLEPEKFDDFITTSEDEKAKLERINIKRAAVMTA